LGTSPVLLARVGPLVFAVDAVCPHAGGLLAEGSLAGRRLECPVHGAVFDVATGEVRRDPFAIDPPRGGVTRLGCYSTRVVAGMVEVDLPAEPPD
jgi:nitrite reductase/ring-hydroxylating ferredoxin subunit